MLSSQILFTLELEMTKIARIASIANPLLQSRGEIAQANDWGEGCASHKQHRRATQKSKK
jgi:hypothetical protein